MDWVLIEFTADTTVKDAEGYELPSRTKGERLRVDTASGKSYVEDQKVAKYVDTKTKKPTPAEDERS